MKKVVISQRVDDYPDRPETRDGIDQRLFEFILSADFLPFPMPNILGDRISDWLAELDPTAVILSGGSDIGVFPDRDRTDVTLLAYAAAESLPVLGICRGLQVMAVEAGVSLRTVSGHVRTRHGLRGEITRSVNSYHSLAPVALPVGYTALARSEDGEIEAFRHNGRRWEGWMWHPERETAFHPADVERMRTLFDA